MHSFDIDVRPAGFAELAKGVEHEADAILRRAAEKLAAQVYAHIIEEASHKLHSSREIYIANLDMKQESPTTWVVYLKPEANWIEDGMSRHEMVMQLLRGGKPPQIAKDGSLFKVIPFKFNKPPTAVNAAMREFQNVLKREFKKQKIGYGENAIEKDDNGQPKVGKLHHLDIIDKPIKTMEGVGQGMGPIGAVRQGMGGTPILKAVNVLQRQMTGSTGNMFMVRDVMTFRVVSSKHIGTGRWMHPGVQPKKLFDEAYQWAKTEWQQNMLPDVEAEIKELRDGQ